MAERSQEQLQRQVSPSSDHLLKVVDSAAPPVSKKSDGNTTFLRAARSGNLEKVLEFINANVDINTSNSNGLNALHLASKDGHKEVVSELLKRGANVDAATKKGNTALHIASLAGQEEVVKLLIENGASVNVQSQSGFTPLYMAAQENHERVVRYLLNNGANQSLATEDGFTPLAVAMQQGHEKVVTELLENDTRGKIRLPALHIAAKKDDCKAAALLLQSEHNNPDITSKSGFTPLHIASHYGNDAIASLLVAKGADVNYAAKHNITPLHVAAKWGRDNMVLLLLDKGASIVAKTRDGLTPLHCAARSGHEQVVDTLLQRHAPITAKTKNGLAPLHMASQGDHVEAARVLLQHRAPVDDVTVDYLTALHVASHCGHVSVAKLLLDRKADPNARALNGFTPLHIACKKNRVKVVELLLKHGASIESTTESGLSPLHVASFMGCMNIVIYLLQCEANPDVSTIRGETPLHLASRANQTDIIRILLRNGAQVDAKAREQQTPLHIAARLGNQDIVMLLLQHGASVDSMTKDQYTSLHIAAKEDQEEVAQVLLDNNASMTATTKKGFTPLHLASKYGRTKIATLLLHRGAPVDAQGKNGVTPLHVASHYDHQGIALLLLDKGASPHAIAKNGHTPLHIAAKKNQMDIAAMLLEYGASAEVESKAGFTPLHLSAQEGHAEMTNLLLEHKSDVNHSSKNGLTPLHLCAQEDCVGVAKILVQNGADTNAVTKAGYTPLHIASHFGQLNMVRYLLSQKVKVDCTTTTGYTPLHQAAQQGNSAIVAVLLDNGASPDSKNNQGQTALCIAQKLGYISVVEVLKNVTEASKAPAAAAGNEEKYKVVAPETMQENFMSDSEDEGGDDVVNEQSYRYLTLDEMKSLGDDSLPLDVTREDRYDTTAGIDESISPQHTYSQMNAAPPALDNVDLPRGPIVQSGFLVSFLVDAKGGAMRGCRHSGVRVIVPPQCVTMPTRVTCRYVRRDKPNHPPPPPLMEGEALASRILELGPVGVKFLGPVVIEVPNFAALRGNEREIVILRSDNGETWREHTVDSSNEAVQEILSRSFDKDGNQIQVDEPGRITSIVTNDFPHYFAVVSRIRQEVHAIGPEGGMVSSSVVPQVQAVFPPGALTKKIKVGLQAQPIPSDLTAAVLGNCVAVSPIVTIEPRRRKFHKPITLTLPVPQAANKGMINQYSGDAPTLRLLCSITGGTSRAQWEDVTGSTPLTFVKECVSFTTTVSARFWLMDIRDIAVATKKATELYREAIHIPFMAKFVVFAKRVDNNEARLRVFCMTDDKEDKTLECQEHFIEVAKSRDVEVLEGKQQLVELSGNLISVTKSGDQLRLGFHAFQENRLPFTVRLKDSHSDPIGRMLFFKEQKPVKMSTPHPPVCVLNIVLPDGVVPDHDLLDSPMRNYSYTNDVQGYHRSELRFLDISNLIGEDWLPLSEKLGINSAEAAVIRSEYPESVPKQALTMLRIWHQQAGNKASANILESALLSIGRDDIVQECILNTTDTSKRKIFENGMQPSKSVMSEIIEDYQIGKHDISSTDDDEKKYTAEEKVVLDDEPKKSVSERKTEIEKRLSKELSGEGIEKRNSIDKEPVVKRQSSQSKDVIKSSDVSSGIDESFEPTTLTFEQKRLSFEKGLSFDKGIVPDLSKESSVDKFVQNEKNEPRHDVKSTIVKEEKIMQIDKANLKIDKPDQHQTKSSEQVEHFHIVKEVPKDDFVQKEKELSFAEKRLSFELAGDAKVPGGDSKSTEKTKADDPSHSTKSEGERRDSELFEGVSLGLGKLEAKSTVTEQNFLSPKPLKTPPPSPAEFKSESLQKQDSEESVESKALPDKRTPDVTESSSKSSDHSSEITDPTRQVQPVSKISETTTIGSPDAANAAFIISAETREIPAPILKNDITSKSIVDKPDSYFVVETDSDSKPAVLRTSFDSTHVQMMVDPGSPVKHKLNSFSINDVTNDMIDVKASPAKDVTPATTLQSADPIKATFTESCAAKPDHDWSSAPPEFELNDSYESSSADSVSSVKHVVPASEMPVDSVHTIETTIIETTSSVEDGSNSSPDSVIVMKNTESIPVTRIAASLNATVPVEEIAHLRTTIDESNLPSPSRPKATSDSGATSMTPVVASPRCEFVKSESICEITYEDENAFFKEEENLGVPIEPLTINYEATEELVPDHNEIDFAEDEARRNELIDLLIEKENAKLIASGILGYDSDTDSEESDENNEPKVQLQHQAAVCGADSDDDNLDILNTASNGLNGSSSSHKKDFVSKQSTYDIIEEDCILRDSPRSYHKLGELSSPTSSRSEHYHVESSERSPQRKVAFRLNSADDDLVYPGQTDSEECNSSSENSEETNDNSVEERLESEEVGEAPLVHSVGSSIVTDSVGSPIVTYSIGSPIVTSVMTVTKTTTTIVKNPLDDTENIVKTVVSSSSSFKPASEVERKFERMASESLDECGPVAEGEFQKIVSQLSVEEVDDCLNEWNEAQKAAVSDDKTSKPKGDKRQHSYAEKETPPVSPRDGVPNVDTDKRECTDYFSKKKFWQSFESTTTPNTTKSDPKLAAPVPKPRASICISGLTDSPDTTPLPPTASRRSSDNISRVSAPPARKDKVVSKSESEDNVLFVAAAEGATARTKPSMRQMHSLTTCSTDSEAEYVASCGVEKLAYENMAFSEEDENRATADEAAADELAADSGNVKAKKMFFEQQIHSSLEDNSAQVSKEAAGVDNHDDKSPRVLQHIEEHLDKSEVESSEKRKQSSIEDIEDPSTATPIDILLTNGCSVEGSADSTRSESDFTPEELRSVSDLSVEAVSESADLKSFPKSSSDQSIGAVIRESEVDRSVVTDIEQSLQKIDISTAPSAKFPSPKEATQPEARKSAVISDIDAQKTEFMSQKVPCDELNSVEMVKSSADKLPSAAKMPFEESKQDKLLKEVTESSQVTSVKAPSSELATKHSTPTIVGRAADQKNENLVEQVIDKTLEMKLEHVQDKLKDPIKNTTDNVLEEVPVSVNISSTTVIPTNKSVSQNTLGNSTRSSSDLLTNVVEDTEKKIVGVIKTEDIDKILHSENVENKGISGSSITTYSSLKSKTSEPSHGAENIAACEMGKTPAFVEITCEKKIVEKDNGKYDNSSSKFEEIKTIEESTRKQSSDIASSIDETLISDQSKNILPSTTKKSISTEESLTILEKVITSEIPVTSVITTKRISINDSPSADLHTSHTQENLEKTTSNISDDKNVKTPSDLKSTSSKKAPIKDLDLVENVPELPVTESTKTTIIISTESGGFKETRTIQEKVVLDPNSVTVAPLTSIIKTEHTVDEFPVQICKEITEITSHTNGATEKSFSTSEKMGSSILADFSTNKTTRNASIPAKDEVKSLEIEKTLKECIPSSSMLADSVVDIKQIEVTDIKSTQLANESSELAIPLKQPEKAVSKIPKPNESLLSTTEKPLVAPIESQELSGAKFKKSSDEAIPKQEPSNSLSKIPKPGLVSKATGDNEESIISTSISESNTPSKDTKSSVKESRIPVRRSMSREKSNESIKSSKGSIKCADLPDEQLVSNLIVSTSDIQSESKSVDKNFGNETSKISNKLDETESSTGSSSKIVTIPEEDKCKVLPTVQPSKSSPSIEVDLSSTTCEEVESASHQQSKATRHAEVGDISTNIQVCDKQFLSSSSIHEDDSSHEGDDISDEQIVTYGYSDKRISISEDEAKVAAENLIDEIETELNQRPDLIENLLLSQMDLLCQDTNDLIADDSNDITDEDLRSTGTEVDIAMPECSDFTKHTAYEDSSKSADIKFSEASPTEYEINYEQVEEFSIPESADFEEHIITEGGDPDKDSWKDSSFGLENQLEHTAAKPPIPDAIKKPSTSSAVPEIRRKSSEESAPRTDILSPESGSSDTPSKRYEDATSSPSLVVTRIKKHHEIDPCSSSSESHYHSFTSRPCSSDVEGMLSLSAVPGSSEYETAASRDTSSYSHEFHTAVSSASIHDSLKSIDSESSGHLGSAEVSSEISETLVPSSGELEHDIDFPGGVNMLFDDTPRNIYSKTFLEPYDQDIPMNIIKGTTHPDSMKLREATCKSESIYNPLMDERLESSCEDMSSLSTTDGGANIQTVVEVASTESDKMDNSLISEQTSLTMSAISNQFSTSSSDFKDEVETDRKTVDTNTVSASHPPPVGPGTTTSVTLLTSVSEDQGRHNVNTQVTSNIEPSIVDSSKSPDISPDGESFELIEKPDLLDDFVVIEEVAKEACEFDTEGRSICIVEKRISNNFDDDVLLPPPQTASTLTHIEYYEPSGGAGDEACSFERVTFEEKQTSDQSFENSPPDDAELYAREVEEGKKWIEMQFQTDSEATAYEYGYERAPLEDIKEEDTDDMQSSKVGSVSSQISQSIGSLGSMKQSLSSTPDYDILAGKRYFSKSAEPDTISQGSLQEFERLEQLMALESMKGKLSSSQDSISSGSNEKKCSIAGDDISVSSLKEFEGLELACGEMDKIEERVKAEEHCLSQIEEGHESQASESESCETLEKSCYESDVDEDDYDKKMFEIDEIIRQAQSNVEKFAERLEKTESLGRGDSFEETSRIPELELDLPLSDAPIAAQRSSSDLYSGKKYIENVDLSHSLTESTDSLELKPSSITSKYLDDPVTSTDSLEGGSSGGKSKLDIASDSLDNRAESPRSEATELLVHDEYDSSICRLSPNQISSPDSAEATSSAATHATYQNDSIMSSSLTSVDSNTMISSTENLEHVVSNYSCWLDGGHQATTITTTKHMESSSQGYETQVSTTRRTVEMPMEVEGVKVVYKGPQAKKMMEQEIASFKPGEYVTETREVDSEGRVRVRRVIETRTVLTSEQVESGSTTLKMGGTVGDASGGSGSCSKVTTTTMQSNLTLAGPASESSSEHEKKKDAVEDPSKDVKKK